MTQIGTDVIQGALKLNGFMEGKCFTSWSDFISAVPSMFSVELPNNITNVTVGNSQPSDSERDHLWVKTGPSGSFIGLFIYASGAWQQVYPVPNEIHFVYGDSRTPPNGYQVASDDANISAAMLADMQKIWTKGAGSPTWYTSFHVTYKGF